jgi:putative addiction module antidote
MHKLKLRRIGDSTGVILPRKVLSRLGVKKGGAILLTAESGGFRLTPYHPEFEKQMKVARKILKKHRAVLRELAK